LPREYRTLQLKVIERRNEGQVVPPIHDLLTAIQNSSPTTADRHVPPLADVVEGRPCSFIDRITPAPGGAQGVTFRFGHYTKGELPLGLADSFAQPSADLASSRLTDVATGARREPVKAFSVLAFGHAIIVESVKGAGGIGSLERCLTELIRRHVDPGHPRIHLIDVGTRERV
jgi:hypothetical protein